MRFKTLILIILLLFANICNANDLVENSLYPIIGVDGASGVVTRQVQLKQKVKLYVLTAFHVVEGIDQKNVPLFLYEFETTGKMQKVTNATGTVVKSNKLLDYAILTTSVEKTYYSASLPSIDRLKSVSLGDKIYSVGRTASNPIWVSDGIISSLDLSIKEPFFGHTSTSYFGSSGGPIYNENFELIGITSQMGGSAFGPLETVLYSVPIYQVYKDLDEKEQKKYLPLEAK